MQTLIETKFPDASPEFLEVWNLQNERNFLKKALIECEEKLSAKMNELSNKNDKVFRVVDMRQRRTVDAKALRECRPDLWEEYGKLSDSAVGKIFTSCMTMRETIATCWNINENMTRDYISISVSDLAKGIGKAGISKLPEGCIKVSATARDAHLELRPEYVNKLPGYNPYPCHDDGDDDDV